MNKEQGLLKKIEQIGEGILSLGISPYVYLGSGACQAVSCVFPKDERIEERNKDWYRSLRGEALGWLQEGIGKILNYNRLIERGKEIARRVREEYDLKYNK